MALAQGDRLGPYKIIAPLGRGGMGEVYRATDTRMGRDVAVKVVSGRFSDRFTREVRAIAALNHPNICTIHDVGPNYLVMEYVVGSPVKGPLPERRAIELAQQIATALEVAHARGIIHRDLKPGNVLVTSAGVKLLDFGLATLSFQQLDESGAVAASSPVAPVEAKSTESEDDLDTLLPRDIATGVGIVMGTPAYMSPEQAAGAPIDGRADIFSFGVMLYEMLTGRRAFAGDSVSATIAAVCDAEPEPIEASPEVAQIVTKCLRKRPAERYRSVMELRLALEKAAAALTKRTPSIAVLPFVATGAPEHEYFGDGLAEDIINALSAVDGLKVIARTSTFAFKHQAQDVRGIARTLGVDHVLEGSVRASDNRIRVTAHLIAASDGTQLWSKRYDRDLTDVFEIQDEISNAIATELKLSLTNRPIVKPPTSHFPAYEAVLQGRYYFFRFDPENQSKALASFEKAISIDPGYAAAHVGVALYHWGQMVVGMADPRETMLRSVAAARQALRLDPASSEAHHILGSYFAAHEFDWTEADRYFGRAIELNPNSLDAYHCHAMYCLAPLGRMEEALATEDFVLAKDPLALGMIFIRALILEGLGREDAEAETVERLNQLDPNFVFGQLLLVRLRARQRRFDEAIALADRMIAIAGRWGTTLGALGIAHAMAGDRAGANVVIDELASSPICKESRVFYTSLIAAAAGDGAAAATWAAASIQRRDHLVPLFLRSSSFELIRGDESYGNLLRMMNISL
jgi:serine/threonine protein kinase/Tfp pilus assembly protein PilF